jgi:LytS/YehU family sensor histidine kinase
VAAHTLSSGKGIGMVNVAERLHVLFGDEGKLIVQSRDGNGSLVVLEFPVVHQEGSGQTTLETIYAARSSTRL